MEAEFDSPANEGQRVSFTATSEKLGIYKKGVSISAGGYLDTNIAEYGYVFYIGEEAAQAIIDYVLENSTEAEPEPYDYRLTGTVTEICDGYFLLDDSVLAAGKGMTFRVPTEDLLISRWLANDPDIFILDEPMVGLDPHTANQVRRFFYEHSRSGNLVLFSSHNLDTVEKVCDRVYIIDQGKILQELDMAAFKSTGCSLESYFLLITQRVAKV